jgi:hypothetical protein
VEDPDLLFPPITPASIRRTRFYVITDEDLAGPSDIAGLASHMFEDPEAAWYYYHRQDSPPSPALQGSSDVRFEETDFFFYQHLNERDFVRILPRADGKFNWDWERQYVATRPQFVRHILRLCARKRRELETLERIRLEGKLGGESGHAEVIMGDKIMGDKIEVEHSQVGAIGAGARAEKLNFHSPGSAGEGPGKRASAGFWRHVWKTARWTAAAAWRATVGQAVAGFLKLFGL